MGNGNNVATYEVLVMCQERIMKIKLGVITKELECGLIEWVKHDAQIHWTVD